jgi:hypothetical protein
LGELTPETIASFREIRNAPIPQRFSKYATRILPAHWDGDTLLFSAGSAVSERFYTSVRAARVFLFLAPETQTPFTPEALAVV